MAVHTKLDTDERFLQSFKRSIGYVKLLAELDLLKDPSAKSDTGDDDPASTGDSNSLNEECADDIMFGRQPSSCFRWDLYLAVSGNTCLTFRLLISSF